METGQDTNRVIFNRLINMCTESVRILDNTNWEDKPDEYQDAVRRKTHCYVQAVDPEVHIAAM